MNFSNEQMIENEHRLDILSAYTKVLDLQCPSSTDTRTTVLEACVYRFARIIGSECLLPRERQKCVGKPDELHLIAQHRHVLKYREATQECATPC
jgi:hypothetical protein